MCPKCHDEKANGHLPRMQLHIDATAMQISTDTPMSREAIVEEMNRHTDWYHKIDLGQGIVTPGRPFEPIWEVCARTLEGVDFRGKRVLDVGACDGRWSFEAERRGAAEVVAVDLFDYALERFLFCRSVLRSRVVPLYNVNVYALADALGRKVAPKGAPFQGYSDRFDVVIFFGVLYHLKDPMLALAQVRSVVKDDGLVLLETAYEPNDTRAVMYYHGGPRKRFYNDISTWWIPSFPALVEMGEGSLLRHVAGSETLLRQDSQVGRVGAHFRPFGVGEIAHDYGYEIANHYPSPLPKIG